jgi:signal transduction histidine kinase
METILAHVSSTTSPAGEQERGLHAPFEGPEVSALPDLSDAGLAGFGVRKLGLVHDLRNLLQVVASALQLIDREADRGAVVDVHRLTRSALLSVDRAADLSRKILDTSTATSARPGLVDLNATLVAMRDPISLTAGRSVAIDVLSADSVSPVRCDRREFENVVLNLVANARDAMPTGGRLTISLFQNGGRENAAVSRLNVVLQVDDTGQGMSDATIRQALTPFFTTKPRHAGSGLGLAMVNDFALRAGGLVQIESIVGKGTSVILRLPSDEAEA